MVRLKTLARALLLVHLTAAVVFAGWADTLNTSEIVSGLKTALDKAVDSAVSSLGTADGYLGNADVKIPVPGTFSKIETTLRLIGQSELADSFVTSMNRAAEKAVPETVGILTEAITNMSFDDARGIFDGGDTAATDSFRNTADGPLLTRLELQVQQERSVVKRILNGGDTAATDFFRNTADNALMTRLEPIVSEAMDSVNVTQYFKNMMSAAKATGMAGQDFDLDGYVTRKALDGLYFVMEQEEANIRQNPVARTSEILKKVFGSI